MFVKTTTRLRLTTDDPIPVVGRSDVGASAPGFFGFRLPLHVIDGDVLTFTFLARQSIEIDLTGLGITSPTVPSEAVDLFLFQDVYDGWYGLSWARQIASVGVGLTLFYSSVSYRQRLENRFVSLDAAASGRLETNDLYFSFSERRLIAKVGASWTTGPLDLGATVTLPSVGLPLSNGTVSVGRALLASDGSVATEFAQDEQEKAEARYRTPLSVALGAQTRLWGVEAYASAEWFDGIDSYDVLKTRPFKNLAPAVDSRVSASRRSAQLQSTQAY